MKKCILGLLLFLPTVQQAQNDEAFVDSQVAAFTQELIAKSINQYVVYKSYCVGETRMITLDGKMCISRGTFFESYVIWNEEGTDKVKKFDNCGSFYTAELLDTTLSDFYKKEWAALLDDEVKPYHSAKYTGNPELRKTPQPCERAFILHSEMKEVSKKFNLFAISNDSEGANLNYQFNKNLKLVAFHELLEKMTSANNFVRE